MKNIYLLLLFYIGIGPVISIATEYPNTLTIRHIEGGGVGYNKGYTTLSFLTAPCIVPKKHFFLDIRTHFFNNSNFACNLGTGLRLGERCGHSILGLHTYYDFRYTHNPFHQIGLGLDFQRKNLFCAVNGYLPLGPRIRVLNRIQWDYLGGHYIAQETILDSFKRCDLELGYFFSLAKAFRFYMGTGPYILKEQCNHLPFIWGIMGTVKLHFKKYLLLEGFVSNDNLFKTRCQGQLSLVFPLSSEFKNTFVPVSRQEIIPLNKRAFWEWNY